MRGKKLVELLKLVDLLSRPQGVTIHEVLDALGKADRKSAYRALETVQKLGFPVFDVQYPGEPCKRWKLDKGYVNKLPNLNVPDISLTLSEVIALQFVRSHVDIFQGTEIETTLNNVFSRMKLFIPDALEKKLSRLGTLFVSSNRFGKNYKGKETIIESLVEAMLDQRTCRVRYFSFSKNKSSEFLMDPLYFFEHQRGLYLFMRSTTYGDIRVLAVERIEKIQITSDPFESPADFSPEAYLQNAFDLTFEDPVDVTIRIAASRAKYVTERVYFQKQRIETKADGSILLTLTASGRKDIKRWILSLGSDGEVLEPKDLRREIVEEYTKALGRYQECIEE